jgi:hypothetical protein
VKVIHLGQTGPLGSHRREEQKQAGERQTVKCAYSEDGCNMFSHLPDYTALESRPPAVESCGSQHSRRGKALLAVCFMLLSYTAYCSIIKMEALCSSETSPNNHRNKCRIPNDRTPLCEPQIQYTSIIHSWLRYYATSR